MTCLSGICRRGACGAAVVIGLLVGAAQAADITDTAFSDASFEEATALVLGAQGAQARPKAAMLWVYRSRLGSLLKTRDLKPGETAELRRICERMHRVARQRRQARFDGYGVEFADGTGDTSELSPSRRVVFFFWDEGRCDSAPSRGEDRMSKGFHILREEGAVTVARRVPVRFDVSAEARFGPVRKLALAQQVRQDLWRALRQVRGFAPVVRVAEAGDGVTVTAGGQVEGRHDRARLEDTIATLLGDPRHVARWTRWAR